MVGFYFLGNIFELEAGRAAGTIINHISIRMPNAIPDSLLLFLDIYVKKNIWSKFNVHQIIDIFYIIFF